MKLCKDCKHIDESPFGTLTYCTRVVGTNLLDGSPESVDNYSNYERSAGWLASRLFNLCGKEGRFFEEKDNANI